MIGHHRKTFTTPLGFDIEFALDERGLSWTWMPYPPGPDFSTDETVPAYWDARVAFFDYLRDETGFPLIDLELQKLLQQELDG